MVQRYSWRALHVWTERSSPKWHLQLATFLGLRLCVCVFEQGHAALVALGAFGTAIDPVSLREVHKMSAKEKQIVRYKAH
jgi:hypothetical protein